MRLGETTAPFWPAPGAAVATNGKKSVQPAAAVPAVKESVSSPVAANGSTPAHVVPPAATSSQVPLPVPSTAAPVLPRLHARIRVDATQLDDLVGLAGELVVVSDNLMGLREVPGVETWIHALEALQRVGRQIRDTTLDLRMVPVDELFSRFPRVVRDLADRSGKEIELKIVGPGRRGSITLYDRGTALRPDDSPDPQRRRPCARASLGTSRKREAPARENHALGRPRRRPGRDSSRRQRAGTRPREDRQEGEFAARAWSPQGRPADDPRAWSG